MLTCLNSIEGNSMRTVKTTNLISIFHVENRDPTSKTYQTLNKKFSFSLFQNNLFIKAILKGLKEFRYNVCLFGCDN